MAAYLQGGDGPFAFSPLKEELDVVSLGGSGAGLQSALSLYLSDGVEAYLQGPATPIPMRHHKSSPFKYSSPLSSNVGEQLKMLRDVDAESLRSALMSLVEEDPSLGRRVWDRFSSLSAPSPSKPLKASTSGSPDPLWMTAKNKPKGGCVDWNSLFIDSLVIDSLTCPVQHSTAPGRGEEFYNVCGNFYHAATLYAQIIITEMALANEQKTIQPVDIGGVAGGSKFVVDGILFKFARDVQILSDPVLFMYGGSKRRDDLAMKAAGNELKGLCAALASTTCTSTPIHMPFMIMVDYLGFRLVATSLLPIDSSTLRYGSNDGGSMVRKDNNELNEMIERSMKKLGLAQHSSGTTLRNDIYGPGDMEGHVGKDGRYYLIDLARLLPPEAPDVGKTRKSTGREPYYELLRLELIRSSKQPLSSDSFTGWSRGDDQKYELEERARDMTRLLLEDRIPAFAKYFASRQLLLEQFRDDVCYLDPLGSLSEEGFLTMMEQVSITTMLHIHGINVRHVGRVRALVPESARCHRLLLLCYGVARVVVFRIKKDMRKTMKTLQGSPSDIPFRDIAITHINSVLSHDASDYWERVKRDLEEHFPGFLSEEEKDPNFSMRRAIDARTTVYTIVKKAGIKLTGAMKRSLLDNKTPVPTHVSFADVRTTKPIVKQNFLAYMALAKYSLPSADDGKKASIRKLQKAESNVRKALARLPISAELNLMHSTIILDRLELLEVSDASFPHALEAAVSSLIRATSDFVATPKSLRETVPHFMRAVTLYKRVRMHRQLAKSAYTSELCEKMEKHLKAIEGDKKMCPIVASTLKAEFLTAMTTTAPELPFVY